MMKIMYIPIDERPCNTTYVDMIAATNPEIQLVMPPQNILGYKKKPANREEIWNWIQQELPNTKALILSIEMFIYGGLIPSRLHSMSEEEASLWINRIVHIHENYPDLPIYASNVIMRTPKYSSDDEEPDYYADWGREIFLRAYLMDKKTRVNLTEEEENLLKDLVKKIPEQFIEDYERRRHFNLEINKKIIELVADGVIHFLAIPQDDSAEFGYTAMDQKVVISKREDLRLYKKIHMYPGADEVGATLLARAYNELKQQKPKIFPIWSSTLGPQLIPLYEDRPFYESLKAHILAAGCQLTLDAKDADIILAYNTPGRVMQESWDQKKKDVTYTSFRNLLTFVNQINDFVRMGKHVIVADSAYANGGDRELITLLDEEGVLDQLLSYKGWNTNCNTLGTTISQGVIGLNGDEEKIKYNLIYHLLDDYFYQAEIRMEMVDEFLPKYNLNYFDLKDKADIVNRERDNRLFQRFNNIIKHSFTDIKIKELKTFAPWNRMFEVGIHLTLEKF